MSSMDLVLSEKYKAFLKCQTPVEFLEGTTAAGKTTVGIFKFMLKVAQSPKKLHILAADDTGTAEKNIINKDLGILDDFGSLVEYNGSGTKDDKIPHILFHTSLRIYNMNLNYYYQRFEEHPFHQNDQNQLILVYSPTYF